MPKRTVAISGRKFAEARMAAFLSQHKMAVATGMTQRNVTRIENLEVASVYRSKIPKIAEALGLTVDETIERLGVHEEVAEQDPGEFVVRGDLARWLADEAERRGVGPEELLNAWLAEQMDREGGREPDPASADRSNPSGTRGGPPAPKTRRTRHATFSADGRRVRFDQGPADASDAGGRP